ncbi:MAG: hypothetical protein ACE5ET_03170 [Gammaproteobacteria bacterium]
MNPLTSAPSLMLLTGVAVLAIICISRLCHNQQYKNKRLLAHLENQVVHLRLSKMLEKLGIPRAGYFKYMTPQVIEKHINNCEQCTRSQNVHICDAYLDRGEHQKSMRFCPNYLSLIANSREFYSRGKDKY